MTEGHQKPGQARDGRLTKSADCANIWCLANKLSGGAER